MKCPHCGNTIPPTARFCAYCGGRVAPPVPRSRRGVPIWLKWFLAIGGIAIAAVIAVNLVTHSPTLPPEPTTPPAEPSSQEETTLEVLSETILDSGDSQIHGFIYYNGALWASTRTSPCRILKIAPDTLNYERVILEAGLDDGEDLVAANGYIWVILHTIPAKIVKIDPNTLTWEVAISFESNELSAGGSLEYAFGYLWAGGRPGRIARIDLSNLTYQIYDYSDAVGESQFHALASGGGYIWGSAPLYRGSWGWGEYYANTIVRINPTEPTSYSSVRIDTPMADDIVYFGNCLYTGSEKSPSYVYKVDNNLEYSNVRGSETVCYGIFVSQDSVWAVYTGSPGIVVEFDSNLNVKRTYQLPLGFNDANEIAFDSIGNVYITCWENPAKVVKLGQQ